MTSLFPAIPPHFTADDLRHLERAFASSAPSLDQIDDEMLSDHSFAFSQAGYTEIYYSLLLPGSMPPLWSLHIEGQVAGSFLYSREPLAPFHLTTLALVPVSARAIGCILLPYYQVRFSGYGEGVWVFLCPHSHIQRGVIISASTRLAQCWQLTYFDQSGLNSHESKPKNEKTFLDLFARNYTNPAPALFEHMVRQPQFYAGQ